MPQEPMRSTKTLGKRMRHSAPDAVNERSGGWQFINLSQVNPANDPDIRKMIRVNAMLHYRRNQNDGTNQSNGGPVTDCSSHSPYETLSKPLAFTTLGQHKDEHKSTRSVDAKPHWPNDCDQILNAAQTMCKPQLPRESSANRHENMNNWETYKNIEHRCSSESVENQSPSVSPGSLLRSSNSDPFNSFPIKHCPQDLELLHHFNTVVARAYLPIDRGLGADRNPLRTSWIPLAITDPVLFQATTNYAAVHLDLLHGAQGQVTSLVRKARTIKMINEQLHYAEHTISNSTIGAIAMMASIERVGGNMKALKIHESALRKVIGVRGGLENLGCTGLHLWISWGHLLTSTILCAHPCPELAPPCTVLQGLYNHANSLGTDPAEVGDRPNALATHYHQLRCLTASMLQVSSSSVPVSDSQMQAFCKARDSVELSLLSLSTLGGDDKPPYEARSDWTSDRAQVFEAQRLAGLIYLNLVLRGCTPTGALLLALGSQLMNTIRTVRRGLTYIECRPKMAMWIYFMGALLTLDDHGELWLAEEIAKTMRDARIWVWKEVEGALKEVLWVDGLQTRACKKLWQKVQGLCAE